MADRKVIYLDNAATTPVDPGVLKTMWPYFGRYYGNASSLHGAGLKAKAAVAEAQVKIAGFWGCRPDEVYFTSGATESDNLAILGLIGGLKRYGGKKHIITSQIEHDAVLEPCRQLAKNKVAEVTFLPVNKSGLVETKFLLKAIKPETALVSLMYVNNEIGTIQPIAEIGRLIERENKNRKKENKIYFHVDATQAPSYLDCDVSKLKVDALSVSAHKIYGPKGVGALYLKQGTPLEPLIFGGHQQRNVRSGTYNVSGIVGLGQAVELLQNKKIRALEIKRIRDLRDRLIRKIKKQIGGVEVNGDLKQRVANNASFVFRGAEGESIVLMLAEKGIAVSTGSACSSGSLEPSHVLSAIGVKPELAHGSLRVTLGRFTTRQEVNALIRELPPIIKKLRSMSPLK